MGIYKTNWQLTETVMPEDMNRIEENTKELSIDLINFKESSRKSFEARDKEISEKAQKSDALLKVPVPEDRDCNSFKTPNAFCTYDTGLGNFKNTPEGTLNQGTARVFMIMNKTFSSTRIQQEFINLYPQNRVTRYIRNFNEEGWGNWYKVYDEANKPTPNDIGAINKNGDKVTGTLKFEANGNEIELVNPSTGLQARGIVFKDNYVNNNIIGMIGAYMNNKEMLKTFMGTTATPWDGRNSFTVDRQGCYFNNQKIYHTGNKPTPDEIGAVSKVAGVGDNLNIHVYTDLDKLNKTCFGYSGSSAVGKPTGQDHAIMQMTYDNNLWKTQLAHDWRNNKVYIRAKNDGSWINWAELYTTNSKPSWNDILNKPSTFSPSDHNHTSLTGVTNIGFNANNSDNTSISTTVDGVQTCMDFNLADDPNQDKWRWRFTPSGGSVFSAMELRQINLNSAQLHVQGDIYAGSNKVYHAGNKPTAADIGAVANSSVSQGVVANTVAQRNSSGDIYARLLVATYQDENYMKGAIAFRTDSANDNYTRYCSNPSAVRSWLGTIANTGDNAIVGTLAIGSSTKKLKIGAGADDVYLSNSQSGKFLQLKDNGALAYDDSLVQFQPQQTPLWSGATYLSNNMNVTPSKPLSECQNGWILVFSDYDPGDGEKNWNWVSFIVPNNAALVNHGNTLFSVPLAETGGWTIKAANITNTQIIGGSSEEISGWNDVVLRQVLEF